jgi:hypothetical protein
VESIRDILASHESGISRDGLLAWARLRVDPGMTDEQMAATLAELGDEVVDVQGFLYLREHAPESAGGGAGQSADGGPGPVAPPPPWSGATAPPAPVTGWVPPGGQAWTPPEDAADPPSDTPAWTPPEGEAWPPPQRSGGARSMIVGALGVAVFVGIAAVGAFIFRSGDEPTPAVPTPTAGAVINADTLAVGDCIIVPSEDQFDEIRRLDCGEPHDGEVFFVGDHPDGDYPSDEAFESFVDERCLPAFSAYTGSDFAVQEVLDIGWFTPTDSAWDGGDRGVTCHLTPIDGSRTDRSYRGANP